MQAKLSASGDEAWKDREAAVLALGAIAEGCIKGLYPHLSEVIFVEWSPLAQIVDQIPNECRIVDANMMIYLFSRFGYAFSDSQC